MRRLSTGDGEPGTGPEPVALTPLAAAVGELAEPGTPSARTAARALRALAGSARRAGGRRVTDGRWAAELLEQLAPHLPVRDAATLSAHHHGLTGRALADDLVRTASLATAAVGAAAGALLSVEWVAPPALLSAPAVLAAETLLQVALEVKLVAELHEALGRGATGTPARRRLAYLAAWARGRGIDPAALVRGQAQFPAALSGAARRQLRARVVRRLARGTVGFAPVAGAVAGGALSRRETRRLGATVIEDLTRG